MAMDAGRWRFAGLLIVLCACALLLASRVTYLYLADAQRFPISTVKISASFQHIERKSLEKVLNNYLNYSFFSLPTHQLQDDLLALDWAEKAQVERIWPDTLKVTLVEAMPIALWNGHLMTAKGQCFQVDEIPQEMILPLLYGPEQQAQDVLQIYQKFSKLLAGHDLQVAALRLQANQAWELTLTNGVELQLGKQYLERRLLRFCRAWPRLFAEKAEQLQRVDLRYSHGMAVRWKPAEQSTTAQLTEPLIKREKNG